MSWVNVISRVSFCTGWAGSTEGATFQREAVPCGEEIDIHASPRLWQPPMLPLLVGREGCPAHKSSAQIKGKKEMKGHRETGAQCKVMGSQVLSWSRDLSSIHLNSALHHLFTIKTGVIKVESHPGFVLMADICAIQMVAFIPSMRYNKIAWSENEWFCLSFNGYVRLYFFRVFLIPQ